MKLTFVGGVNQFSVMDRALKEVDGIELRKIDFTRVSGEEIVDMMRHGTSDDLFLVFIVSQFSIPDEDYSSEARTIAVGKYPQIWKYNTVPMEIAKTSYGYLVNGGIDNYRNLLLFLKKNFGSGTEEPDPPREIPLQGYVTPACPSEIFQDLEEYRRASGFEEGKPSVGMIIGREVWLAGRYQVPEALIESFRKAGVNTIAITCKPKEDFAGGAMGAGSAVYRYLTDGGKPVVDGMIYGSYAFGDVYENGKKIMTDRELVRKMDVPVFSPINFFKMDRRGWEEGKSISASMPSHIILPEYAGFTDPIPVGFSGYTGNSDSVPEVLEERCMKIAERVSKRLALRDKPNRGKKVVIFLNIDACMSLESSLGLAHGLASFDSVHALLARMKEEGYDVEVPESGEEIRKEIVRRAAYPEYRWTPLSKIIGSGGCLDRLPVKEYAGYFDSLGEAARKDVERVWGPVPGTGMVDGDSFVITGVKYGNAIVSVQPKRGCVGSECSGKVCKILSDRNCPPSHAYLATYMYFSRKWGADMYIHMGSHGTMEHLPGRSAALTANCYPDIVIGDVPMFYVFNVCDSANATLAKRRAYATMIDHMNIPGSPFIPYGPHEKMRLLLSQHHEDMDPAQLSRLAEEADGVAEEMLWSIPDLPAEQRIERYRTRLGYEKDTFVESAGHRLGDVPDRDGLTSLISSSLKADDGSGKYGSMERIYSITEKILNGSDEESLVSEFGESAAEMYGKVLELKAVILSSDEMGSLIHAMSGGFTDPGPSGAITRGTSDAFPTGRNMYAMNPFLLPVKSAYEVGKDLGRALIARYREDNGEYPEEIAFAWLSSDLTIAGGEMLGQMMYMIGVEPVWADSGKVSDVRIIPKEELDRPRIDVLVRLTGSISGMFRNCTDLLDKAIVSVSELDEPTDFNFVRKHTLQSISEGIGKTAAESRIFGCGPAGGSGIFQALSSGAWESNDDLAKIFFTNNGYSFGEGKDGVPMHDQFSRCLSGMSATFNRIASDERDILISANYVAQGGLAITTEYLTKKKVKSYFGDTRDPRNVGMRTLSEEIGRISAVKITNPRWLEEMRKGGYQGGTAMLAAVSGLYGWQATTHEVDDRIFDRVADMYVNDRTNREFLQELNPYALEAISRRLLEAEARGLWKADPEVLSKLRENYLLSEADMEDLTDGYEGFQGSTLEITRIDSDTDMGRRMKEFFGENRRRTQGKGMASGCHQRALQAEGILDGGANRYSMK